MRFSKVGKVRWTSHRDVARMWERAFRRIDLRLAWTEGFSPRPKVSFGLALPTGAESVAEYLDVELADGAQPDVAALPGRLSAALPAGIDVLAAAVCEERGSLQEIVTSCRWEMEAAGTGVDALTARIAHVLAADSLVVTRERKGQPVTDDVRPAILSLAALGAGESGALLECELATLTRGLRPSELLAALDPQLEAASVRRTHQWIQRDGAKREPIPLPATAAPHAERAS
ncbi:MAG TPA: TIGR03936 family radical SAM-associated protein [Acidimicrobiales bacterium]|nr:TIGR03936 family radical SAM-associated protein [Acidimicrobiales bacterium]